MSLSAGDTPRPGIPRPVEALVALAAVLVAAPVIAAAGLLVKLTSSGPALFRQERVGRHGRHFRLYKMRTMRAARGGPLLTARHDSRITPVGRLLRRTKIDELPQFWNVLKGDMSLVGPRPEVPRYVDHEDLRWKEILQVRPGITDPVTLRLRDEEALLASVEGDPDVFYREKLQPLKLAGYVQYLRRRTVWTDFGVFLGTLARLIVPSRRASPSAADLGHSNSYTP